MAKKTPLYFSDVPKKERDRLAKSNNALPDGSYPIADESHLHSAAILAKSHHGDWKAAMTLIARRAKELGVKNPLEDDKPTSAAEDEGTADENAELGHMDWVEDESIGEMNDDDMLDCEVHTDYVDHQHEHADGTITISPSIEIHAGKCGYWHGFLERGIWREC